MAYGQTAVSTTAAKLVDVSRGQLVVHNTGSNTVWIGTGTSTATDLTSANGFPVPAGSTVSLPLYSVWPWAIAESDSTVAYWIDLMGS